MNVGDTLRFTYEWRQQGSVGLLRTGLSDSNFDITASNWTSGSGKTQVGYFSFVRDNDTANNDARYNSNSAVNANANGTSIAVSGQTTHADLGASTTFQSVYDVTFDITLTSLSQIDTTYIVSQGGAEVFNVKGTHIGAAIATTFDTAFIRTGTSASRFDNMKLELIPAPEPGSVCSLALTAIATSAFRRRRIDRS